MASTRVLTISYSVYQAVHFETHRAVACKVVSLTKQTSPEQRKVLEKEMKVHAALKHRNVLEFIGAKVVGPERKDYYPAVYMVLELAAGGDLFDKIGACPCYTMTRLYVSLRVLAPDIGVSDDVAHYYFTQLANGLVRPFVLVFNHFHSRLLSTGLHSWRRRVSSRPQA